VSEFSLSQLQQLHAEISTCERCGLCKTRTNAVPGVHGKKILFMLIGEAPGKEEDLDAKPFVGWSGQILKEVCSEMGVDLSKGYITNIVKCRPTVNGRNRAPSIEELEACKEWLTAQITAIDPPVVVTAGKFSTAFMVKADPSSIKVKDFAGKRYQSGNRTIFPIFHPAYAGRCKQDDDDDFFKFKIQIHRLKLLLEEIEGKNPSETLVDDITLIRALSTTKDPVEKARILAKLRNKE
jgi:uracil-DNA glycosylase